MANQKPTIRVRHLPTGARVGLLKTETGRTLHGHEVATLNKLLRFGYDIYCQIEANLPYVKVADIMWQNEQWEIKNITGNSKYTILHSIQKAKKQSSNIVLDVSDSKMSLERAARRVKDLLRRNGTIKKVIILTGDKYCIVDKSSV